MKPSCEELFDEAQEYRAAERRASLILLLFLVLIFAGLMGIVAIITRAADFSGRAQNATVSVCDDSLAKHVYNPKRLQVLQSCATVTGTIIDASHGKNKDGCRHEADGDGHCFLKLDPGQEKFINTKNLQNEDGALVFEPMCRYTVTQADAKAACKNWRQNLFIQPIGSHVKMTGVWVLDTQHGHGELHPVSSIEVLK